jgi:hypothetical protein
LQPELNYAKKKKSNIARIKERNNQGERAMRDLGKIQAELMSQIKKASEQGDGNRLGVLGPIAAEMDRIGKEWESRLTPSEGIIATSKNGRELLDVKFAGKRISSVTILGEHAPVGSYREALLTVAKRLRAKYPDFDSVAPRVRGRFPYFSENKKDLRLGEKVTNSKLYIETHNSADRQWKICAEMVRAFGHDPDDPSILHFDVAPNRTRAVKGTRMFRHDDEDEEVGI